MKKILVSILFLLSLLIMIPSAQSQEARADIHITTNHTVVIKNQSVNATAFAMDAQGNLLEDQDPPPKFSLFVTVNETPQNGTACWNWETEDWIPGEPPEDCFTNMTALNTNNTAFFYNFSVPPKTEIQGANNQTLQAVVTDYQVQSTLFVNDVISGEGTQLNYDNGIVTERELNMIGPEIAGLTGSQLLEILVWTTVMGIAMWNNWIFTSIASAIPLFGPIFRNAGSFYPINFVAGVFLVVLSLFLEKYAGHWGKRFKGWLTS